MKGAVCTLVLALVIATVRGQGITFGFGQSDYTRPEPDGVTIEVTKSGANVGDLYINIAPLTYAQLEALMIPIPTNIGQGSRPDPAEFDTLTGKLDFNNTVQQVVFPATTSVSQVQILVDIEFFDDDINEAMEGFYIHATVDETNSDPMDAAAASPDPALLGVALVNIADDDIIQLTFEEMRYSVTEDAGVVDNLVYVIKQDGRASEQTLRVLVEGNPSETATRGPSGDYIVPILEEELVFEVTDTRLNISFEVFEDMMLEESPETFTLVISVPQNPPANQLSGDTTTTFIDIRDNEVGIIGFLDTKFTFNETDDTFDIPVGILNLNISDISPSILAFLFVETVDGTAVAGEDFIQLTSAQFTGDNIDILAPDFRGNAQLRILDDTDQEGLETLQLRLVTNDPINGFVNANFTYDPTVATVCILDDEQPPTTQPTTTQATTMPDTTMPTSVGLGGDPHYSILLPTGQLLCYSVHGEHDFVFNLISNKVIQMNALFISDAKREEVTWIGELGVVVRNGPKRRANTTAIRFCAPGNMVCIGDKVKLQASGVDKITFSQGKLSVSEREEEGDKERPEVLVEFPDVGISFTVMFVREKHLDMKWNKVEAKMDQSHGMIGQFFRNGVEIDEARRLLVLPDMDPVPVARKPVWHFMERDSPDEQLCWVAMNPGYQGKKLLQGHYLDYLVDDVLSSDFKFKPKNKAKKMSS